MGAQTTKFSIAIATLVSLLAMLTGCGGGSGDAAPTKAEYLKEANFICQDVVQEREDALKSAMQKYQGQNITKAIRAQAVMEVYVRPSEQLAQRLADLQSPDGEEKQVDEIIGAIERAATDLKGNPELLSKGDPFRAVKSRALAYGLNKCAA